ncbi:hypothetical protein CYLTODRAFT_381276 [Cylindrobasidium torrendii FP15055 ss-10]|uniref:RRM domain-containing protein n=1 Tax=Cylindrobasidium torrendii FP15055 ss-10 TaxID=1314674 RepID=A0A0D7B1V7_9AGAR|nr:hypothetical protein CYLTODRAFT_381276 [Cylindrobasidium torrendii FP15055 ss-10]
MASGPPPLPDAFKDDPRVFLSTETHTWRYEEDDGTEMEYNSAKGGWLPVIDDDLMKQQQAAYAVAGVDEETPAAPVLARDSKKRKAAPDYTGVTVPDPAAKRGKQDKSKNTSIYVTGLPLDTTDEELITAFSRFGVLEEDYDGEPKVKMYAKDDGTFSGEALVVYFKEDSVSLALNILDESELRLGDPKSVMHLARADFAHKHGGGGSAPANNQPRRVVDKKKATRRIVKMQKKLEEWNDEDGFGPALAPEETTTNKPGRVVVLKHMFTLQELEEDATLLLDLKEDVRDECASLGEVTNVVLFDQEPDGIMTVKFKDPLSAQACVVKMNGRFFAGRRIEASVFFGKQRFRRSDTEDEQGTEEERLARFNDFIMQQDEED